MPKRAVRFSKGLGCNTVQKPRRVHTHALAGVVLRTQYVPASSALLELAATEVTPEVKAEAAAVSARGGVHDAAATTGPDRPTAKLGVVGVALGASWHCCTCVDGS